MKQLPAAIATLFLLASCSFNGVFLQPTQVPAGAKRLTMSANTDTTVVAFAPGTHQPVFLKNGRDTIHQDFSIESVVYKSSSGNLLNGWLLKPKGQKAAITILHLHGNAGFLLSQYQAISPLVAYGFQVFIFDYSGYGFSEGEASRDNVLLDALSSLDYLKGREDVKGTRLVLYGQSLGGHLSAVVGAQRQNDMDALVIEGAFSSHKDIGAHRVPLLGRLIVKQGYSATRSIKEFHKPLLVIHSTE